MTKKIKTAVIGSYPVKIDNQELIKKYYQQQEINWEKYIKKAVNDMQKAKIDIISDGQTKDPFIQIFTRKLKGCRVRNITEITDKIQHTQKITVKDQKYVKKLLTKKQQLIGLLTGPYTLTKSCKDLYYNDEKQIAFDFAKALQKEAKHLEKTVDLISIDEPFFSNQMPEYSKELIEIITKKITKPTRLHICGDVSKIIPQILEIKVDILSHEFKLTPKLFNEFKKYDVQHKICLGSVRSDNTKIETVEEITKHIQKGLKIFDDKINQISPDCGLRMLPQHVAFQKLKNLAKAGEKING